MKELDVVGESWLMHHFNAACKAGKVPLDWHTGVVIPLSERGTGCCATVTEIAPQPSLGRLCQYTKKETPPNSLASDSGKAM